ncbi:telomere-associated protein RIF1 isoform X3 [Hypanus sabinus]|uniref:telomere-associated protein RIF1 isoform X3 n=1 Tax=Hypanus sabinus TaxID=79690 RepID=UPI0028C425DD|nr:telomere-associated protein RIF1 isoform X3 [Hypanus sabinus]
MLVRLSGLVAGVKGRYPGCPALWREYFPAGSLCERRETRVLLWRGLGDSLLGNAWIDAAVRVLSTRMMAAVHPAVSGLLPLLATLEDSSVSSAEQVDAYLTISSRLSGEDGKEFVGAVGKQFTRLCEVLKGHLSNSDLELCNAALQALGFCVFHSSISAALSAPEAEQLLLTLCDIAVTSSDKNTCTRALWVMAKQTFSPEVIEKKVPKILSAVETIFARDQQSVVVEHEALNLIVRLLEQTPEQMGQHAVQWVKLLLPLVVHSAPKVRLRAATALELGLPLLLQKQQEVAVVTEPLMMSKIIPEMQKLFTSKNETYVLKLWPLFVKLLGKSLHRGGSFINSLLHLEELGFRSGSPVVKKIAFIAWKSLIDNFALNPDILCSAKRLRLLMQPLSSIHVRTEVLGLAKLEVWWYLALRLGPQLSANFEQVCVPMLLNAFGADGTTHSTSISCRTSICTPTTPASAQKPVMQAMQLVGVEILLHFLTGPAVTDLVKQNNLQLSLDPLQHPLINSPSFFCKHAGTLINAAKDAFISVGKLGEDTLLNLIWQHLISFVKNGIDAGSKKERQVSELLTLLLQALQQVVTLDAVTAHRALGLIEATVKGLPQKVLGSPAYQVANMDILNGTPALFLIILLFHNSLVECCVVEERFFTILEILVGYGLSGPTCSLAFSESVLNVVNQSAALAANKEHLWRMWSIVVNPLTDRVTQTNEVNQGDALEHDFRAMYIALTLPINHLFTKQNLPQSTVKSVLKTWADLYKTFARCAALVATAEANVCCEELSVKILAILDDDSFSSLSSLEAIVHILNVMVECVDFSQFSKFQQKANTPHTPTHWLKKKQEPLGNLTSLLKLLVKIIDAFHELSSKESQFEMSASGMVSIGSGIVGILSNVFTHLSMASAIEAVFTSLADSISIFYERTSNPINGASKVYTTPLSNKLEKLHADILHCLQSRYTSAYDSSLLEQLSSLLSTTFLHKNRQIRNQTAQFWNATFAKATTLNYPQLLKPILSRVKQKTPIILPGFEALELTEESSGPYSDLSENSQLDAKISGVDVNSVGKRNSLLAKAEQLKEKTSLQTPAKLKLDFSPKTPRREVLLEEEQSLDFVFIPPEPKQRILTEHQKEVLQTKRTDIPAMYNNLDASQDSHLFSQYAQSQEESLEKLAEVEQVDQTSDKKQQADSVVAESEVIAPVTNQEGTGSMLLDQEKLQDSADQEKSRIPICLDSKGSGGSDKQEETRNGAVVFPSDCVGGDIEAVSHADVSGGSSSSDVVSGTPQKTSSRRQSFITLEKFDSSTPCSFSKSPISKFTQAAAKAPVPLQGEIMEVEDTPQLEVGKVCQEVCLNTSLSRSRRSRRLGNKNEQSVIEKPTKRNRTSKSMKTSEEESSDVKKNSSADNVQASKESDLHEDECSQNSECQTDAVQLVVVGERKLASPVILKGNPLSERPPGMQDEADEQNSRITPIKTRRQSSRKHLELTVTDPAIKKVKIEGCKPRKRSQNESVESLQNGSSGSDELIKEENNTKTSSDNSETEKSSASKTNSQEPLVKSRPRYLTRRSSQGLSEAENSCCDVTETESSESSSKPQNGPKKRKVFKGKTKTKELSPESSKTKTAKEHKLTMGSQLCSETETGEVNILKENEVEHWDASTTQTDNASDVNPVQKAMEVQTVVESSVEMDPNVDPVASDEREQPEAVENVKVESNLEQCKFEAASPVVNVEPLPSEAGNSSSGMSLNDCSIPPHEQHTDKKNQQLKGCHLRSKRTRKTKSCDCCQNPLQQHGKSLAGSKENTAKQDSHSDEQKEHDSHLNFSVSSAERLSESSELINTGNDDNGPCAFSTPINENSAKHPFGPSFSKVASKGESTEEKCVLPDLEASVEQKVEPPSAEQKIEEASDCGKNEQVELTETGDTANWKCHPSELVAEPVSEPVAEPVSESVAEPVPVPEPVAEPVPVPEPVAEPVPVPEPVAEPVPEPVAEPVPEPVAEPVPEPVAEPMTDNAAEPAALLGEPSVIKETQDDSCVLDHGQVTKASESAPLDKVTDVLAGPDESEEPSAVDKSTQGEPETAVQFKDVEPGENEELQTETQITATVDLPEQVISDNNEHKSEQLMESPQKIKNDSMFLTGSMHSPSGMQACCVWSPTASPSTSILKKGIKRQTETDSPSPLNKIRRVSFADPIHREGLADDIDRRSPVVRSHSSGSSPALNHSISNGSIRSSFQYKYNTTPTKGFQSPSARNSGCKSSKKCLISEMSKESVTSSSARVYPALVSCSSPVETILPQLASNMWARGLGQLVRAKNIKTIGDLSSLTVAEIKLLPIRSPKVFVVRKALKAFYENQRKSLGLEEDNVFEGEKLVIGTEDTINSSADEEKLATDLSETAAPPVTPPPLISEVNALHARFFSENLNEHSGGQLFTMHHQLRGMMDCIMVNLQSRWRSPPHEAAD